MLFSFCRKCKFNRQCYDGQVFPTKLDFACSDRYAKELADALAFVKNSRLTCDPRYLRAIPVTDKIKKDTAVYTSHRTFLLFPIRTWQQQGKESLSMITPAVSVLADSQIAENILARA